MRCPKCHYISFESVDRCRNCGYDLSLSNAAPARDAELALNDRNEEPSAPADLSLSQIEGLHDARRDDTPEAFDLDRIHTPAATPFDLPLFTAGGPAAPPPAPHRQPDAPPPLSPAVERTAAVEPRRSAGQPIETPPLIRAAAPRPPIAVRRPTPDARRLRARYPVEDVPRLDLEPPAEESAQDARAARQTVVAATAATAPAGRRVLAGAVDAAIVGGIDVGVLYFTLKLCALPLSLAGVAALPIVPLVGFFLLLDGGYAVTFTAVVGQTIGKMATGLRVIRADEEDDGAELPAFGMAVLRTAAYAASLLPVGLGFLPALIGKDRRALHDRLADTRVIRVGPSH